MRMQDIVKREPIHKGWSSDRKFCVATVSGEKYLLRISPAEKNVKIKALFEMLKQVSQLDIPFSRPVACESDDEGVSAFYTWIDGEDAQEIIPLLPEAEQTAYGLEAGKILRKIHSIPAPQTLEDWHTRFNRKTDYKIKTYRECGVRFDGDDHMLEYLKNNRDIFRNRPQSFQHGDYHIGNMMVQNGKLVIIDFDRFDFGDPWEEFNRIVWCAQVAPRFASGMIDGYFEGEPPFLFWQCLAFYIGSNTLSSVYWAAEYGQSQLDVMLQQVKDVLSWYDGYETVLPSWYDGAK